MDDIEKVKMARVGLDELKGNGEEQCSRNKD
jgi:hypothetical protein